MLCTDEDDLIETRIHKYRIIYIIVDHRFSLFVEMSNEDDMYLKSWHFNEGNQVTDKHIGF